MIEEKKKSNKGLVIIIVVLVIALCGTIGYICYDKIFSKSEVSVESNSSADTTSKNADNSSNNETYEDSDNNNDVIVDNRYVEKVYSNGNSQIILFESGNCVVANFSEYTANCKYYIEDNRVYLTKSNTGINDGSVQADIYDIRVDEYNEYIKSNEEQDLELKLLK